MKIEVIWTFWSPATDFPRFWVCEIGKIFFAVDVETKSIVTFEEPIEVIHPLKGIFQIYFLEDRYST